MAGPSAGLLADLWRAEPCCDQLLRVPSDRVLGHPRLGARWLGGSALGYEEAEPLTKAVRSGVSVVRMRYICLAAVLALLGAGASSATNRLPPPLLGANFIRYDEMPPHCGGPSIVYYYDSPGVRGTVRQQLAAMRAAGMRAMRLIFYHASQRGA